MIAPFKGPGLIFAGLTLVIAGSWAWFAVDDVSLLLAAPVAVLAFGCQMVLCSRLQDGSAKPLLPPALQAIANIAQRPVPGGRHLVRDEITGLHHRWYFEMRLEDEAARCDRYGYSMAVVVLRFGSVELADIRRESWPGRAIAAAEKCVSAVRRVDLSGYLAPNEFAICLVHCDVEGAQRALDRLQAELSEYSFDGGISVFPIDGCGPLALIDLARIRSRQAKAEVFSAPTRKFAA